MYLTIPRIILINPEIAPNCSINPIPIHYTSDPHTFLLLPPLYRGECSLPPRWVTDPDLLASLFDLDIHSLIRGDLLPLYTYIQVIMIPSILAYITVFLTGYSVVIISFIVYIQGALMRLIHYTHTLASLMETTDNIDQSTSAYPSWEQFSFKIILSRTKKKSCHVVTVYGSIWGQCRISISG